MSSNVSIETHPTGRARGRILATLLCLIGAAVTCTYAVLVNGLTFGAPLVMVGLGGMTLVLTGLALFRTIDPLLRPHRPRVESLREPARVRELEREKQLALKAIREVEHDFQMKKIAEVDYQEMLGRYRARAMRLIRELDAGENYAVLIEQELKNRLAGLEAAGALAVCPGCGLSNDRDARFCKGCGKAVRAGGAA